MFAFSALFSADVVSASFDRAIHADASNGRVNVSFTEALMASYGVAIPASPAQAVRAINEWLSADKAPRIAKGHGATLAAPAVAQALHALGSALHASPRCKGLIALVALADWADPAKVEAKRVERSAAAKARSTTAKAEKATAAPVTVEAPMLAADAPAKPAKAPSAAEALASAVNTVLAAAKGGHLTQAQIDALRSAVAVAQPKASKQGTARKAAPAAVVAGKVSAPMLGKVGAKALESARADGAAFADAVAAASAIAGRVDAPAVTH